MPFLLPYLNLLPVGSDAPIARTTPALLGLVCAGDLVGGWDPQARLAATPRCLVCEISPDRQRCPDEWVRQIVVHQFW